MTTTTLTTTGERIRDLRNHYKWKQMDVVMICRKKNPASNMTPSTISRLESDAAADIYVSTAMEIAQALGTTVEYLFLGVGNPPTKPPKV